MDAIYFFKSEINLSLIIVEHDDLFWCDSEREIVFWMDCSIRDLYLWVSIETPWNMFLRIIDYSWFSFCSNIWSRLTWHKLYSYSRPSMHFCYLPSSNKFFIWWLSPSSELDGCIKLMFFITILSSWSNWEANVWSSIGAY